MAVEINPLINENAGRLDRLRPSNRSVACMTPIQTACNVIVVAKGVRSIENRRRQPPMAWLGNMDTSTALRRYKKRSCTRWLSAQCGHCGAVFLVICNSITYIAAVAISMQRAGGGHCMCDRSGLPLSAFCSPIEILSRRGVRAVEGARLESVCTPKAYRGFESLPLRH